MDEKLNSEFRRWIGRMALEWAIPIADVPKHLGYSEVENRLTFYPALGKAVTDRPVQVKDVDKAGLKCWALGERFHLIRFGEFVANVESADAIAKLADDFPSDGTAAAHRIDTFTEKCVSLGYTDPKTGRPDMSGAALLVSTILTSTFPQRFVDFRQARWTELAEELDYPLFKSEKPTYGEMLVEAGEFAAAICATDSFKRFWPTGEPLWTIAGVCWDANSQEGAKRPKDAPIFPYEEDFDEGAMVLRAHLIRERSTSVVRKAKELWRTTDPLLHCDVCGFSFIEAYGECGEGYIEAHHTKPLNSLKAGAKTRVSDLAKVCSNCHRMLHIDGVCLSIEELQLKVRFRKL